MENDNWIQKYFALIALVALFAVASIVELAKGEGLTGRCVLLSGIPEQTISLQSAKEALAHTNRMLVPVGIKLSCRWSNSTFPSSEIRDVYYRTQNGALMSYSQRQWGDRLMRSSAIDFYWVVSPELPLLPGTRGSSYICLNKHSREYRGLITYLDILAPQTSSNSLIGMHFGHLLGADNDENTLVNGLYSAMSHKSPQGGYYSSRSQRQMSRCKTAQVSTRPF